MKILIRPVAEAFLQRVRERGVDDLNEPVRRLTAAGGEPCREVLRRARPGEEIILASYCPFEVPGPFREFGPIYVLAHSSDEAVARDHFPESPGRETDYFGRTLVVRAYDDAQNICDAALTEPASAPALIEQFLGRTNIRLVDARFPTYGCFACRIERACD